MYDKKEISAFPSVIVQSSQTHASLATLPHHVPRNPYYKNERKTAEVHILRPFDADFYASHLRVVVTGFLRNELNFTTLEALIDMIQTDIRLAKNHLTSGSKDFALSDAAASFFAAPQPLPVPSA